MPVGSMRALNANHAAGNLVNKLERWYPLDTPVILHEATQLSVQHSRADRVTMCELPQAHYREYTILVIPTIIDQPRDESTLAQLAALVSS